MNIGIDLGTSYSSIAAEINGKIEMIKVATGASAFGDSFSMPTAVYIDNGEVLLGQAALNRRRISPQCFKSEFKRDFGTTTPYIFSGEEYLPEQLYTEILLYFKDQVLIHTGEKIKRVYLTHPANYGNNKKRLLEKAANNAGFFDVVLIDEPTAAAAGYSQKNKLSCGDILLVYDLGGGTFDTALIKKTLRGYGHLTEPLGISQCGGADFDRVIFDDIMQKMSHTGKYDIEHLMREKRFTASLSEICIQIKHQLSQAQDHTEAIAVGFDYFEYRITRQEFEDMIRPTVSNTCEKVKDILRNSGLTASDIDRVLLVGGSSRVPLVQKMVADTLKKEICFDADPELAVCQGAVSLALEENQWSARRDDILFDTKTSEKPSSYENPITYEKINGLVDSEFECGIAFDIDDDKITIGMLEKPETRILCRMNTGEILSTMGLGKYTFSEIQSSLSMKNDRLGDKKLSAQEVYANIFSEIKRKAESCLGKTVSEAVMAIPVNLMYFQRAAIFEAAEKAGLNIMRLFTKTASAAFFYGSGSTENRVIVSVNIEGGGAEAALCDFGEGVVEVAHYYHMKEKSKIEENVEAVLQYAAKGINEYVSINDSSRYLIYINGSLNQISGVKNRITDMAKNYFKQWPYELIFEEDDTIKCKGAFLEAAKLSGKMKDDLLLLDATYYSYIAEINGERHDMRISPCSLPTMEWISLNVKNVDCLSVKIYLNESNSNKNMLCEDFTFDIVNNDMELDLKLNIDVNEIVYLEIKDKEGKINFKRALKGKAIIQSV